MKVGIIEVKNWIVSFLTGIFTDSVKKYLKNMRFMYFTQPQGRMKGSMKLICLSLSQANCRERKPN